MGLSDGIWLTGDPVLEEVCGPVGEVTDEVRELAQSMLEHLADGVFRTTPADGSSDGHYLAFLQS